MISKEDLIKLSKLHITNLLDLSLVVPKKYENNVILNYITNNEQTFQAKILSTSKNPKFTKVKAHLLNVDLIVDLLYFNIRPWQIKQFSTFPTIYIKGVIKNHQIVQPKVVNVVNQINVIYKTAINSKTLKALIKKYIIIENLQKELPKNIAQEIYNIHFPTKIPNLEDNYALKFTEIYNHIKKLQTKKRIYPAIKKIKKEITPFFNRLPFKLTNAQLNAIEEIQKDLDSSVQARRVIIGDVGSGKTIVMLASAYMAEKSIIMCPTSILANQIYEEACKYLDEKVTLVTQKSKFSEEDLNNSKLLVGTHALLYQNLPQVDLVMVDEQHRFGTMQREQIARMTSENKKLPHFLQFSATPIPRTQALILSNFVNITLIKELPFKKDIDTFVIDKSDFRDLMLRIKTEISNNNQVIIVYPLVEESKNFNHKSLEEAQDFWFKNFKKVYVTHGKDKNKEEVLEEFKNYGNILLTTTVIEVGISLPRLTTIVIVGAERMGLATLHQLRGRVARYGQKGYCYLYTNDKKNRRLQEFAKTLDGFKIAELDLMFRKSGDLLDGSIQSGRNFEFFDEVNDIHILENAKEFLRSQV
jgi:ATP-dependent DNA helicase RecG